LLRSPIFDNFTPPTYTGLPGSFNQDPDEIAGYCNSQNSPPDSGIAPFYQRVLIYEHNHT